jgi:hypothetical protein
MYGNNVEFKVLKGKMFTSIENIHNEELIFTTTEDEQYRLYHSQDCCEDVRIEDICGNLDDLIGSPILMAEEVTNADGEMLPDSDSSFTWTFYKLATIKGYVTIRWYGTSNGYYSESVDFEKV